MDNITLWIIFSLVMYGISVLFCIFALYYDVDDNGDFEMFMTFKIPHRTGRIIMFTPIVNTIFGVISVGIMMSIFTFIIPAIVIGLYELYKIIFKDGKT